MNRVAHLLDPQLKGVVLYEYDLYEKTKEEVIEKWSAVTGPDEEEILPPEDKNLSSVERLMMKRNLAVGGRIRGQRENTQLSSELITLESFSPAPRGTNILGWWKDHSEAMPTLGRIVREVSAAKKSGPGAQYYRK